VAGGAVGVTFGGRTQAGGPATPAIRGQVRHAEVEHPDASYVNSWCIDFNDGSDYMYLDSCDIRYLLGGSSGDRLVSDEMESTATPYSGTDLTYAQVEMDYYDKDYVVEQEPQADYSTGCKTDTLSFTWYGLGFSTSFDTCGGTVYPYGLGTDTAGDYWSGVTSGQITLDPAMEVHASSTDPATTFYVAGPEWEYGESIGGV
jgi:hypothetical protein